MCQSMLHKNNSAIRGRSIFPLGVINFPNYDAWEISSVLIVNTVLKVQHILLQQVPPQQWTFV